jgi:membrane protease YdiL (CAAX protease family)
MREALAWTMALQNGVLVLAGAALAWWRCPPPEKRTPLLHAVTWGLLAGVSAFALSGMVAWLQELAGVPVHEQEPLLKALKDIPMAAAFPWVAVVAPLGEETFFRGYLFRFLASRTPRWLAYGASACAFAGIHLNPSGFLVYVAIALVLAGAYRRTGALLVPFLAHAVHNAITLIALYTIPATT